jgi:hypothetical protein
VISDCRLDRRTVGDALVALTWERLAWTAGATDLESVRGLSNGQWAMLVLDVVQREVGAGGFAQLLGSDGDFADDMVAAARLVGGGDYVAVLAEALVAESLEECDAVFAEITGWGTDLVDCAVLYARRHPEEFFLDDEEAEHDEDAFVARVRHAAGTPRASERDVLSAVERVGRPLPRLLERLYREAGDGGWAEALPLAALAGAPRWIAVAPGLRVRTGAPALPVERDDGAPVAASLRGWLETWLAS